MLEQQATVTQVKGDQVTIRSLQTSACSSCASQDSCGTSVYAKILPERELTLTSSLELKAGDTVIVGIEEAHLVKASLFMYLFPLVIMLLVVGLYDGSELTTAIAAGVGLAFGLWLVNQYQHRFTQRWLKDPKILKKC
jgi:sigma-E factor negative regulatory protein RseC